MNKKELSERDICTKFTTPALKKAQWDLMNQIREEVSFTKGRIIFRGKLSVRGDAKRADYALYHPLASPYRELWCVRVETGYRAMTTVQFWPNGQSRLVPQFNRLATQ